jgi:uncharacterized protein (DUF1800 family)
MDHPAAQPIARHIAAALAAHRFGLGEPDLAALGSDPAAWLAAQIGPADAPRGQGLASLSDGIRAHAAFIQTQRRPLQAVAGAMAPMTGDTRSGEQQFGDHFRPIVQADVRSHLATAVVSTRPFAERLAWFWANHFTVSVAKASARALVGAFEREAIRPHIAGTFGQMLKTAVTHGAMVRYLDNEQSAGPRSRVVALLARRAANSERPNDRPVARITGLNENLGREVLELHTLGAASKAYTQADVTALAAVLTGWRIPARLAQQTDIPDADAVTRFDAAWHEPGPKTVLGKTYGEGAQALDEVLQDLATHPATARHLAHKLARHFVADAPPPALVAALEQAFLRSGGDLPTVYRALLAAPDAWSPQASKLKTPAEFIVSTWRLLGTGDAPLERNVDGGAGLMGQRLQAAPSPAGWPDRAEDWLGPDAMWKRVEWATRVGERFGRQRDARALARKAFGPLLSQSTATQLDRAADGPQALALLLMAPEFQRR